MDDFDIIQIESISSLWDISDKDMLCTIYDDCFGNNGFDITNGGEEFIVDEVANVFEKYVKNGLLILSRHKETNKIIGFAAALPLTKEVKVWNTVQNYLADALSYWYHADLGVMRQYRRKGLANEMAEKILSLIPSNRIVMRARVDNEGSIALHKKLGFTLLLDAEGQKITQWVPAKRKIGKIIADERIFFTLHKN